MPERRVNIAAPSSGNAPLSSALNGGGTTSSSLMVAGGGALSSSSTHSLGNNSGPGGSSKMRSRPSVSKSKKAAATAFNPKLIFSQIVAMQCFHYLILGLVFQINHVLYNTSITVDRIFTDKYLNLWSIGGWADNFAVLLTSCIGYVALLSSLA